jgi:hypothetical protein
MDFWLRLIDFSSGGLNRQPRAHFVHFIEGYPGSCLGTLLFHCFCIHEGMWVCIHRHIEL